MTTNRMPFSEDVAHNSIIVDNQRKHAYAYPSKLRLSDAFRATVDRMLTFEEAARPWVGECQSLPWFRHVLPSAAAGGGGNVVPPHPPPRHFSSERSQRHG